MASLNKVTLIGNLGKDPEMRYTQSQQPFAKFSLATSEVFTSNGERQEKTQWHNIVIWGKQAEIAGRYLKKGKQIYCEGIIEYREYEDKDGQRRFFTEIKVFRFLMLGSRGGDGGYAPSGEGPAYAGAGGGSGSGGNFGGGGSGGGGNFGGGSGGGGGQPQGGPAPNPSPMTYGAPMAGGDVPESDDFNDDDIPF